MKRVKCFIMVLLILALIGCTNYVKIYEKGSGEEPPVPILMVEGVPTKGEVTFEKTTGEGETRETLKLTVKKEGGGNPLSWFAKTVSGLFAFLVNKSDLQIDLD